ncbi:MAG: hypothetical protein DMG34_20070, partial [Acidobacteria bacterium]
NVGDGAFTLTVNGTNFVTNSVVNFAGSARTTAFASSAQLTASIPASDLTTAGTFNITVTNPAPGGGTSKVQVFTVNNATPTTTSILPTSKSVTDAAFTLTVNGTNFVSNSTVNFNGSARTTTFVSATQLTAAIPATDLATAGTFNITVTNPAPGGGTSNAQQFTVSPKLVITSNAFGVITGICSSQVTTQTQNQNNSAANQNPARTLNLSSDSGTGKFFSDAACSAPNQITSTQIAANASTASLFYSDTTSGAPTITVASTGLTSATQAEAIDTLRFQGTTFSVQTNQCSTGIVIQAVNPNPTALTQSTTIALSSSSAGGKFYSDATCPTQITSTPIAPGIDGGHDTNNVYYKDTIGGTPTLTASAGTASVQQTESVVAPPSISKSFGAASIPVNGTTSLSFTITNPAANTVSLTGVAFTDTLPAGLLVNTPNGLSGTCGGGTITAVAGSSSVSLSGATLAANASCTFSVNVKGTTSGAKNNTTAAVTSTNGGTGNTASASVTVTTRTTSTTISPLTASTPVGTAATLTITVTDTDSGPASNPVGTLAVTSTSSPSNTDSISACALTQGANPVGTVSCQVNVTPTTPFAVHTINASFTATDSVHANSSTTTGAALTVFNPDTKPPVVTVTFSAFDGQNGWYVHSPVLGTVSADDTTTGNSNVTAISCTDGVNALTVGSPTGIGTHVASGSLSISGEGTHNISCQATDSAGNTGAFTGSTAMPVVVKIDTVAPVLSATRLTAANANGWNNTNVNVEFTCSDSTSGLASISATGATTGSSTTSPLDVTVTSEGSGQSVNGTKPVITGGRTPAANANNWNNTNVTVSFTCADTGGSGVDTNTVAGATVSTEGENQSVTNTGSCVDKAGNAADSSTVSGINIDKTPPNAPTAVRTPAANANGWNNTDVSVSFTSGGDAGTVQSGVDSCTTG